MGEDMVKFALMKRIGLLVLCAGGLLASYSVNAQNNAAPSGRGRSADLRSTSALTVTGIWRGYFVTEMGEQYRLEFQVAESKRSATGVSYSYLDKRFYGKATMTGAFSKSDKRFRIQELRTVEVRNLSGGGTCIMNYDLTLVQSGQEFFLEGTYLGRHEDRNDPRNNGKWGDCGNGRVFLRKVETSDFYVEPFLRNTPATRRADTVARRPAPPVTRRATPAPPARPNPAAPRRNNSTRTPALPSPPAGSEVNQPKVTVQEPQRRPEPRPLQAPAQTRNRENATARTLDVRQREVLVKLYDNGDIDDDTVSIYLNNKLLLANKRLSAAPIEFRVQLTEEEPELVLVMVAENLGRIPPNTSLMLVFDGDRRHEVQITSTEQKNAMVRFRLQTEASSKQDPAP